MLDPDTRELLLDVLRPPDGYRVDRAIATTFTLDLEALLFAPLAFSLFDWATDEAGTPNPIAILEGVRRYADRTTVFCQAGQIAVPDYKQVLTYVERTVVPVSAPDPEHIFHPKVWTLRFVDETGDVRYRVLCLSRNLTFDRSWDTLLALDGVPDGTPAADDRNAGLSDFVRYLAEVGGARLDADTQAAFEQVAAELATVRFEPPQGFRDLVFHPIGHRGGTWSLPSNGDRILVVSPFLAPGPLASLSSAGGANVLVSRLEALDGVGKQALAGFAETLVLLDEAMDFETDLDEVHLTTVDAEVEVDAQVPTADDEAVATTTGVELSGLHAKLFVIERGNQVRLFTGSANATDAAFGGNVEFLVELATTRMHVSIDQLLRHDDRATTLRDLLGTYNPPNEEPSEESAAAGLERALARAQRRIGQLGFRANVAERGEDHYLLDLEGSGPLQLPPEVDRVRCWPVSLGEAHSVTPTIEPERLTATFGQVSRATLTSFFAFELLASRNGVNDEARFVVNAELVGAPKDRRERVLIDLLASRDDVLRYLLFLLADLDDGGITDLIEGLGEGSGGWNLTDEPALFETMVKALRKDPERLDHLAALIDDLHETGKAAELLPKDIDVVWQPIWQARKELAR